MIYIKRVMLARCVANFDDECVDVGLRLVGARLGLRVLADVGKGSDRGAARGGAEITGAMVSFW